MSKVLETIFRISGALDGSFRAAISAARNAMRGLENLQTRSSGLSTKLDELKKLQAAALKYMNISRQMQANGGGTARQAAELQRLGAALRQAGFATDKFGASMLALLAKIARNTAEAEKLNRVINATREHNEASSNFNNAWTSMSNAVSTAQSIMQPFKAAVDNAETFEHAMSKVKALTQSENIKAGRYDQVRQEMKELEAQARELGATTQFTMTQAAEAQGYLGMAGWSKDQIIKAMPGMLDLAAASGMDLARTADIVSDNLTALGLDASQVGHMTDVYAYALTRSNLNMEALGEAMKYAAPAMHAYGGDIHDAAAAMMIMGNAGIKGSMAGTALRMGLLRLAGPPKKASKEMEALGVSLSDATRMAYESQAQLEALGIHTDANMKPTEKMAYVLRELSTKMQGLSKDEKLAAVGAIFGVNAASGWLAVLEQGPEAFEDFRNALRTSDGTAKQVATTMNDDTRGAWLYLESAIDAVSNNVGTAFLPALKSIYEGLNPVVTSMAQWIGEHPGVVQGIGAIAAATAGGIVALGGFRLALAGMNFASTTIELIKATSAFNALTGTTGIAASVFGRLSTVFTAFSAGGVAAGFGAIGTAISGAAKAMMGFVFTPWGAALAALAAAAYLIYQNWEQLEPFFEGLWNSIAGTFSNAAAMISPALANMMSAFDQVKAAMIEALGGEEAFSVLMSRLSTLGSFISSALMGVVMILGQALAGVVGTVVPIVTTLATVITDVISGLVKAITAFFKGDMAGAIKEFGTMVGNVFKDMGQGIFETLKGVVNAVEGIIDVVKGLWDGSILSGKHDYQMSASVEHKRSDQALAERQSASREQLEVSLKALKVELPAAQTDEGILKAVSTLSTAIEQWRQSGSMEQGESLKAALSTLREQAVKSSSEEVKAALTGVTASFEKAASSLERQSTLKADLESIMSKATGMYDQRMLSMAMQAVNEARSNATSVEDKAATAEALQQFAMTATAQTQTQQQIMEYVRTTADKLSAEAQGEEKAAVLQAVNDLQAKLASTSDESEKAALTASIEQLNATMSAMSETQAAEATEKVLQVEQAQMQVDTFGQSVTTSGQNMSVLDAAVQTTATSSLPALDAAAMQPAGSLSALGAACDAASAALSGLGSAASAAIAGMQAAASQISAAASSIPTGGITPQKNAVGGIYPRGEFLTTFAEDSPEAAIPIKKGDSNAISLWQRTGAMLGVLGGQQPSMPMPSMSNGYISDEMARKIGTFSSEVRKSKTYESMRQAQKKTSGSFLDRQMSTSMMKPLGPFGDIPLQMSMVSPSLSNGIISDEMARQGTFSDAVRKSKTYESMDRARRARTFSEELVEASSQNPSMMKAGGLFGGLSPLMSALQTSNALQSSSESLSSKLQTYDQLEQQTMSLSTTTNNDQSMPPITLHFHFDGAVNREDVQAGVEESLPSIRETFEQQMAKYRHEVSRRSF